MNNNYYQSPKSSKLMRMFWRAAGADQYLLERSTYSDQIKYFCLGGIVVATGVMAALAGGYAIYTIFEPKGDALDNLLTTKAVNSGMKIKDQIHFPTLFIATAFGIVWGLIIYNIDRFIVASTGKGDGTEAITKQEFRSALPRIVMGLIIAITISKPIEIRMFKTEIDLEVQKQQDKEKQKGIKDANLNFKIKTIIVKNKLGKIQKEIDAKQNAVSVLRGEISNEITGKNKNGANYGPRALQLERQAKIIELQIKELKNTSEYKNSLLEIEKYEKEKEISISEAERNAATLDGLLIRITKAHELSPWVSLFITLLFMVIELTPIFFKMMLIKGPYDYMDDNIKDLARAESGIEVIYNYYEDAQGMEAHKVINHAAELKRKEKILILQAQEELNEKIILNWKLEKLKDIEQNPNKYITEK